MAKDPFTKEARAAGLRTRQRNAKLRRQGKLPPTNHHRVTASLEDVAQVLTETGSMKHAKTAPMKVLARLIVAVAGVLSAKN